MGCVIFTRDKNKNYGLININLESYNNFINGQINNNNNLYNNNIRIYNDRNKSRYDIENDDRNNNRNNNRNSNRNNNRNINRNNNNRNYTMSSRKNTRNNNLLNNILNNSYENNIPNNYSNRNIVENGNYFFIHTNIISNRRNLSRRRNIHHTFISPHKRKIKKHLLNDFPEIEIKDISKLEEGKKKCTICLEDFIPLIKVVAVPLLFTFFS